jgi:hypothetical protein
MKVSVSGTRTGKVRIAGEPACSDASAWAAESGSRRTASSPCSGQSGSASRVNSAEKVRFQIRERGDGGARALDAGAAVDGNARGHRLEPVHRRSLESLEELPGVGAEALDEAALSLGIEGVHREAALAAAGHTGDGGELPGGQLDADARQVVGAGTLEVNPVHGRGAAVVTGPRR